MAIRPCRRTQPRNNPDHVLVHGKDEHHPEGCYHLEWREDEKRRRQPVFRFDQVVPAARTKAIELQARKAGILVTLPSRSAPTIESPTIVESLSDETRPTMAAAVDR